MKIPVYIKWVNNVPMCICMSRCKNCKGCERDVVIHNPYNDIKEVTETAYIRVNGRLRRR